ncbi:hypothetical protein [Methylobacterium sp. Leaf125]|uniref:hypothetical protein n=1 Tax=Methylobacterium sp. Leaf125 TaxID=1736265 RepID=UPI000A640B7B|nr:hypothetical protein [Methylobacterium sp. Leaf125]
MNDLRASESQQLGALIGYLNALTLLDVRLAATLDTSHLALQDSWTRRIRCPTLLSM